MAIESNGQADASVVDAPAEDAMIEVQDLTHYYGPMPAVENVNFTVRRGELVVWFDPVENTAVLGVPG